MADRPGTSARFALSACSAKENNGSASGKEKTDMRTYQSAKGNIDIPAHPKRIVTDFYAGELLSVDANVVGAGSWAFKNPFIKTQLKHITDVGNPVNVEKVMQLKPDLIVLMKDDQYEKLSKIAPTIVIPFNTAKIRKIRSAYSVTLPERRIKPKALWQTSTKS